MAQETPTPSPLSADFSDLFRAEVQKLITDKLVEFWQQDANNMLVPWPDQVDAVAGMAEMACDWISGECERLGTKLATE